MPASGAGRRLQRERALCFAAPAAHARAKHSPPRVLRPLQAAAWILCIVGWLVWLLEKIVAFINRNAYIMVAVKGCAGDAQLMCRARLAAAPQGCTNLARFSLTAGPPRALTRPPAPPQVQLLLQRGARRAAGGRKRAAPCGGEWGR